MKTLVCVTTILVRVVTLSALVARDRVSVFLVIATFSPRFKLFCWQCLLLGLWSICYTRVDESSKTICGAAAEEP
nr:MAG TPA: hypothetical protein [Caudoviricetes sp.]